MFGIFKKKPPALEFKQVKVFGKLPGFPDFVRYRSADAQAIQLDTWVSEGHAAMMREGRQSLLESDWVMSLCRQQGAHFSIAYVLSSQDKSGRHYPFVITAEVESAWLLDYIPSLPLLFRELREFAEGLRNPKISTQQNLLEKIARFEETRIVLTKGALLEQRILALKFMNQDQSWGAWTKQASLSNPAAWKLDQLVHLPGSKLIELPIGGRDPEIETCYWLQLSSELQSLRNKNIFYCALSSRDSKKLIIQQSEHKHPKFNDLFDNYIFNGHASQLHTQAVYQGQMSLLEASGYWSKFEV